MCQSARHRRAVHANGGLCSHWLPMNETAHSIALSRRVLAAGSGASRRHSVGHVPPPLMARLSKAVQHPMFRNTAIENTFENPVVLHREVLPPHTGPPRLDGPMSARPAAAAEEKAGLSDDRMVRLE